MKRISKASNELVPILVQRLSSLNEIILAHLNSTEFSSIEPHIMTRQKLIALLLERIGHARPDSTTRQILQDSLSIDRKIMTALNKEKNSTLSLLKELYLHKNKFSGYNLNKVI